MCEIWAILTAIGTLLATIVALIVAFKDDLKKWIYKPNLKLYFSKNSRSLYTNEYNLNLIYIRVFLENIGTQDLKNLKVKLNEIKINGKVISPFDPVYLRWTATQTSRTPEGEYELFLSKKDRALLDLFYVLIQKKGNFICPPITPAQGILLSSKNKDVIIFEPQVKSLPGNFYKNTILDYKDNIFELNLSIFSDELSFPISKKIKLIIDKKLKIKKWEIK